MRVARALLVPVVAAAVALAASGCLIRSGEAPPPVVTTAGPPTTSAAPAPAPTTQPPATPPAAPKLAANGLGPYTYGAKLATLKSAGALVNLNESTGCPGWATAEAKGFQPGSVKVIFYNGAVSWIEVLTQDISTVDGAAVGMTFDQVKAIYGAKATQVEDG